jgi:hypothetical protein
MIHTELSFKRGKKKHKFSLVHNLDEFQLSIDSALLNWSLRTDTFTEQSFIDYVKSKDPVNIICITKKEYDENNNI